MMQELMAQQGLGEEEGEEEEEGGEAEGELDFVILFSLPSCFLRSVFYDRQFVYMKRSNIYKHFNLNVGNKSSFSMHLLHFLAVVYFLLEA